MRILLLAVCASLLLVGVSVMPTRAQSASVEFQAIIVAPNSVELANTGAITIMAYIRRLHGHDQDALPSKIILETTQGRWIEDSLIIPASVEPTSPQEAKVDAYNGFCTATLLLADVSLNSPLRVDVLTAKDHPGDQSELLGSKEISLHYPALIKFGMVPQIIPADGKTQGAISLYLLDEEGRGIKNEPLLLQGYGPQNQYDSEIVVSAITNGNGYAIFVLPSSSHVGRCLVNILGPGVFKPTIATWKLEIDYVANVQQYVKPLQMDRFWWKQPYHIWN